ncbi:MAG: type I pantothenate kinase [Chthonomonadales bacterium]
MSSSPDQSAFIELDRHAWSALRESTPLTLTEADLMAIRSINESVSLREVTEIYLPLSRLINLHVSALQNLRHVTDTFLKQPPPQSPFIIGLGGSVAVGKSLTARIMKALLSHWPEHPKVEIVTTDGFLLPNAMLQERDLMNRKGFPESYNLGHLLRFVREVKFGSPRVTAPVYSHLIYDIVPDAEKVIERPDILILEGLNVLQRKSEYSPSGTFVSDYFDFSVYVDASEENIEEWYVHRFMLLRESAFRDENSYFHHYTELTDAQADAEARRIWREINLVNLRENILPTRERASVIIGKGALHDVDKVLLKRR